MNTSRQPYEATPRRGNLRGNVIKGAAAVALVATGASLAALRPWQNHGATPDQAREAIAGHQFDHPHILTVEGRNTLSIKVSVPTDPTAAADMKQYAAENSGVTWLVPSGVTSYTVGKDPKSGKYSVIGPGFEDLDGAVPDGEPLIGRSGIANIVEHPNPDDPIGTKVALFTETEAMTSNSQDLTRTDGSQYLGTIEKTLQGWKLMPDQPQLPGQVTTTTSPW